MEVRSSTTVHSTKIQSSTIQPGAQSPDRKKAEITEKPVSISSSSAVQEGKEEKVEELEAVIQRMNEFMKPTNTFLRYKIHDKTHEYYVEIVNSAKDEVIREIPSKRLLDMYASMTEYIGLMFDKKV